MKVEFSDSSGNTWVEVGIDPKHIPAIRAALRDTLALVTRKKLNQVTNAEINAFQDTLNALPNKETRSTAEPSSWGSQSRSLGW